MSLKSKKLQPDDTGRWSGRMSTDRYALQRRKGFPWLRFFPDLEAEFRASFVTLNKTRIRIGGTIGMLGCFGFIFVDQVLGMNLSPRAADLMLVGVTVPSIFIPMLATFHPPSGPRLLSYVATANLVIGLSVLAVICVGRASGQWFPYESLLLVTTYIFFVSGLLYYQAITIGVILWAAFTVTNWNLQQHSILVYEVYYLGLANALSWLGMYMLEWQMRDAFLLERELSVHALLDSLTGTLNRRAFRRHLDTAWRQAQREGVGIGVMLVDLDGFKSVNDTGGHPFGDHALQRVGQMIRESSHRPLDAVGRYGGDEFIAIWYGVDPNWFENLARELPGKLPELSAEADGQQVKVAISGGAVLAWPQPGTSPDDAIRLADQKLYEMKRTARGTIGVVRMPFPGMKATA